jgi:uncharacterized protein (TIGR00156 family)
MKKIMMMFCAMVVLCGVSAYAQFKDDAIDVSQVSDIKSMSNKSWVVLDGSITKRLGDEKYMFRDVSGEITVIVANSAWQGTEVTPKLKVRITGQIKRFLFLFKQKVVVKEVLLLGSSSRN